MIKQNIRQDHYDSDKWLKDLVFPISVQLLNSASYKCVTGESPPPCPIDAKAYADAGLPSVPELSSSLASETRSGRMAKSSPQTTLMESWTLLVHVVHFEP